jgi:hypothetical protein
MTASEAEHLDRPRVGGGREPLDEQVRRRGIKPITSVDDFVCDGVFDADEELDAFLAQVYAERRANLA